ncbi:MAG: alpha/beta fold hydrolase [Polyangiales bacterium]
MELPRRPFLGVALSGRRITKVLPGSCAERAGLVVGDELLSAIEPRTSRVQTTRGEVFVEPRPFEPGAIYGQVEIPGARLRTIVRKPANPWGSVLYLQGISLASIESFPNLRALCTAWSEAGLVTLRVDKRGAGDSDGPSADFAAEVAGAVAAFDALPPPVFVFGHSVGGMIAPLLERPARGSIVYGTASTRWRACLAASTRRQLRARTPPLSEATIETAVRAQAHGLAVGDERSAVFHAQLESTDLAAAWRAIEHPVLVLHGENDLVVGEDEGRAIAEQAKHAEFRVLPSRDHDVGPELAALTVAWIRERA